MESYANDFLAMALLSLVMFPLIWTMQRPSFVGTPAPKSGQSGNEVSGAVAGAAE